MRELFVYYRVGTARSGAARAEVERFQCLLRKRYSGLQARLLRRPGDAQGLQTWMETYAWPTQLQGVSATLQAEVELAAAGLASLIDGPRHAEPFEAF